MNATSKSLFSVIKCERQIIHKNTDSVDVKNINGNKAAMKFAKNID